MGNNKKMGFWKHYFFNNKFRTIFQNPNKILSPYIKAGDFVVDYGCGTGFFAIPMKKLVTSSGQVFAIDIEERALKILDNKVNRGINSIVVDNPTILNSERLKNKVDFVLSFWALHGMEDKNDFLEKIKFILNENGKFLLVEPKIHIKKQDIDNEVKMIVDYGFLKIEEPNIKFSHSVLFKKRRNAYD